MVGESCQARARGDDRAGPEPKFDNDVFTYLERERKGDLLAPGYFDRHPVYGADPPIRTLADARDRVRPHATSSGRKRSRSITISPLTAGLGSCSRWPLRSRNSTPRLTQRDWARPGKRHRRVSGIEHAPDIRTYGDEAALIAGSGTTHTPTYGAAIYGSLAFMRRRHGWPWEWALVRRFLPPSARLLASSAGCTGEVLPANGPSELDKLRPLVSGAAGIVTQGGRVGIGSHGNIPGLGFHYEMWLHARGVCPTTRFCGPRRWRRQSDRTRE